jgi:hypothetical protein
MSAVLTEASEVTCQHKGVVTASGTSLLTVEGNTVLLTDGVSTWSIAGCTQTSTSQTPCTKMDSAVGGDATKLTVGGVAVLLDTISGKTIGLPQFGVSAKAKQTKLTAS